MEQTATVGEYPFGLKDEFVFNRRRDSILDGRKEIFLTGQEADFVHTVLQKNGAIAYDEEVNHALGLKSLKHSQVLKCRILQKCPALRVDEVLRRHHSDGYSIAVPDARHPNSTSFGNITYFPDMQMAVAHQKGIRRVTYFTREQNALLRALASQKGSVVKKEQLYRVVLELGGAPDQKLIDVVLCRIRKLLGDLEENAGQHLVTEYGVGAYLSDVKVPPSPYFQGARLGFTGTLIRTLGDMRTGA